MCGIIGAYEKDITNGLASLRHRGPDSAHQTKVGGWHIGHTRLEIIAPGRAADQPICWGPITLVLNGEIWNYLELRAALHSDGVIFKTTGDAEVFAALFAREGTGCLSQIKGMFAAAIYDERDNMLTLIRDRFGEIPLHYMARPPFAFASELKGLKALDQPINESLRLPPGYFARCDGQAIALHQYYTPTPPPLLLEREDADVRLYSLIEAGVKERLIGEAPICTLLSGGIDSTAIAHFLSDSIPDLQAYIAVFDRGSEDLTAARAAADFLGITLHEVMIPVPSRQDLIKIVEIIEMPHKAQVEIAWPCYVLGERMKADGFKVVFSGDGSDELWASYGFAQVKLSSGDADYNSLRRKLFLQQENKNFARANKIFMHYGIEPRLPFLHQPLVEFALSLDRALVHEPPDDTKAILRRAFTNHLPDELVSRRKVAFQIGLGLNPLLVEIFGDTRKLYLDAYNEMYGATL